MSYEAEYVNAVPETVSWVVLKKVEESPTRCTT